MNSKSASKRIEYKRGKTHLRNDDVPPEDHEECNTDRLYGHG